MVNANANAPYRERLALEVFPQAHERARRLEGLVTALGEVLADPAFAAFHVGDERSAVANLVAQLDLGPSPRDTVRPQFGAASLPRARLRSFHVPLRMSGP